MWLWFWQPSDSATQWQFDLAKASTLGEQRQAKMLEKAALKFADAAMSAGVYAMLSDDGRQIEIRGWKLVRME